MALNSRIICYVKTITTTNCSLHIIRAKCIPISRSRILSGLFAPSPVGANPCPAPTRRGRHATPERHSLTESSNISSGSWSTASRVRSRVLLHALRGNLLNASGRSGIPVPCGCPGLAASRSSIRRGLRTNLRRSHAPLLHRSMSQKASQTVSQKACLRSTPAS
jgi:hypothetical protein